MSQNIQKSWIKFNWRRRIIKKGNVYIGVALFFPLSIYIHINSNYSCKSPLLITETSVPLCICPSLLFTASILLLHYSSAFSTHSISMHRDIHVDNKLGDHPKNISSAGLLSLYLTQMKYITWKKSPVWVQAIIMRLISNVLLDDT